MAQMTEAELRAVASRAVYTDPRPGTDWVDSTSGRVVRIVNKPIDPDTGEVRVCYYEGGQPIYVSTIDRFLEEVDMPDGSRGPRHRPVEV